MTVAERIQRIDRAGRIAVSDEAKAELGLVPGTRLTELVVDGMLIYIPPQAALERARELDLERASAAFRRQLDERGISADDINAEIERSREATFAALYPELVSE